MAYLFANSLNHNQTIVNLLRYVNQEVKPGDSYKGYTGSGNVKKEKTINRLKGILKLCGINDIGLPIVEEVEVESELEQEIIFEEQPQQTENLEPAITVTPESFNNEQEQEQEFQEETQAILNIVNNVA